MQLDHESFETEDIYFVATHPALFNPGIPALITGIKSVTPLGLNPRLCYEIRYSNGTIDYVPVSTIADGNAIITTMDVIAKGEIFKTLNKK